MIAERILTHLERVRPSTGGPGRWIARCPAHQDRSASLSIRQLDDGRILLHCFAGCEVGSILAAIGLHLRDLFPTRTSNHRLCPERTPFAAVDVLQAVAYEVLVVKIAAEDLTQGDLPPSLVDRLRLASRRLSAALDHIGMKARPAEIQRIREGKPHGG